MLTFKAGIIIFIFLIVILFVVLVFARSFGKIAGRSFLRTLDNKLIFLKGEKNGKKE